MPSETADIDGKTKTVALFGGSFNPIHIAHSLVVIYLLETEIVDEVWMVPTFSHVFGKELIAFSHRKRMCEISAANLGALSEKIKVLSIEEELAAESKGAPSRTLDTIAELKKRHPNHKLRLVVGTDILSETDKWHRWDDVCKEAPPIVIGRLGADEVRRNVPVTMPDISSSSVRFALKNKQSAEELLSRAVLRYIEENRLYID